VSVSMMPNWSNIRGLVRSVRPSPDIAGFSEVELSVENVSPVQGFANLLADAQGASLVVLVPTEVAQALGIVSSDVIEACVRRAGLRRAYVHREEISVQHRR